MIPKVKVTHAIANTQGVGNRLTCTLWPQPCFYVTWQGHALKVKSLNVDVQRQKTSMNTISMQKTTTVVTKISLKTITSKTNILKMTSATETILTIRKKLKMMILLQTLHGKAAMTTWTLQRCSVDGSPTYHGLGRTTLKRKWWTGTIVQWEGRWVLMENIFKHFVI